VDEHRKRRAEVERAARAARSKPLRLLDRALLVAEVVSALVVSWLVVQYVYTVYFDTAPRRVTPQRSTSQAATLPGGGAATTPTPGATEVAEAAPEVGALYDPSVLGAEWAPARTPTSAPSPQPTIDPALLLPVRLRIPVMFLDSAVHEVTINMGEWEVSPMDIGHHAGTGNPGEVGNVVLAGHRDINSALFRELDRLEPGDELFVSNSLGEYRYIVEESYIVTPEHTEVMDPTDDKRVTLITCTPPGLATQRLVVTALLDE
jgi:sortase A